MRRRVGSAGAAADSGGLREAVGVPLACTAAAAGAVCALSYALHALRRTPVGAAAGRARRAEAGRALADAAAAAAAATAAGAGAGAGAGAAAATEAQAVPLDAQPLMHRWYSSQCEPPRVFAFSAVLHGVGDGEGGEGEVMETLQQALTDVVESDCALLRLKVRKEDRALCAVVAGSRGQKEEEGKEKVEKEGRAEARRREKVQGHMRLRVVEGGMREAMLQAREEAINQRDWTDPTDGAMESLWRCHVVWHPTEGQLGVVLALHHSVGDGLTGLRIFGQFLRRFAERRQQWLGKTSFLEMEPLTPAPRNFQAGFNTLENAVDIRPLLPLFATVLGWDIVAPITRLWRTLCPRPGTDAITQRRIADGSIVDIPVAHPTQGWLLCPHSQHAPKRAQRLMLPSAGGVPYPPPDIVEEDVADTVPHSSINWIANGAVRTQLEERCWGAHGPDRNYLAAVVQLSKEWGCTVHQIILALSTFATAIVMAPEDDEAPTVRVASPYSLRRACEPPLAEDTLGVFVSAVDKDMRVPLPRNADLDSMNTEEIRHMLYERIRQTAQQCRDAFHFTPTLRDELIGMTGMIDFVSDLPQRVRDGRQRMVACRNGSLEVSNLGRWTPPETVQLCGSHSEACALASAAALSRSQTPKPTLICSDFTFDNASHYDSQSFVLDVVTSTEPSANCMWLSLSYQAPLTSRATAQAFLNVCEGLLATLTCPVPTPFSRITGVGMGGGLMEFGHAARKHFMLGPRMRGLNHGSYGTVARVVHERRTQLLRQCEADPESWFRRMGRGGYRALLHEGAHELAGIIGAKSGLEVAFVDNVTTGVNAIASSLTWDRGDKIVLLNTEYLSTHRIADRMGSVFGAEVIRPQLKFPIRDVEADAVRPLMRCLAEEIESGAGAGTEHIKLIVMSEISSEPVVRFPVREMVAECRRLAPNALILVDGAHCPGMVDIDVSSLGADAYVANLHKWYFASKGTAFLWVGSPELRGRVHHPVVSLYDVKDDDPGAFTRRFQYTGTRDFSAWCAFQCAAQFMRDTVGGLDRMREYNAALLVWAADYLQKAWGTTLLAPLQDGLFMANVQLPVDSLEEALAVRNHLFNGPERFFVFIPENVAGVPPYVRISAQVYLEKSDFEYLAQAVLDAVATVRASSSSSA